MINSILSPGEKYFQEPRKAIFRKEEFTYIHTGIIDTEGEMWTTTEMDEANIFQVYNQYRALHGIPFPDEIIGLRQHYGLSAAKMSQILGFGINQYRMYEDGEVPSISNARIISAAREKRLFLSFIEASRAEMGEQEYLRIRKKAEAADGDFRYSVNASVFSGFRSLSKEKVSDVARMIIQKIGPTFVTKMNKMFFYADFIHYKNHGFGITGIKYRALPYGPVPEEWGALYNSLKGIEMEEYVYPSGQSGIRLISTSAESADTLTESEIQTINRVCELFAGMNAGEISKVSHSEKGWIDNNVHRGEISYQDAFSLRHE